MAIRGRRSFLKRSLGTGSAVLTALTGTSLETGPARADPQPRAPEAAAASAVGPPAFKLGLVTYELAKDWDIDTIIRNCEAAGFEGVELRTTHQHGVEPSISKERRQQVRRRFQDSRVRLVSLGSTCEYESPDPSVVRRNVEETRRFCELAQDLGCLGVKVRPNGYPPNSDHARVLQQIGQALHECGDIARDHGVEIWLEVHGPETQVPANIHRIMQAADHPSVGICWNSNDTDVVAGSVTESFDMLKKWLRSCHINELWRTPPPWPGTASPVPPQVAAGFPEWKKLYPWHELFSLFRSVGYDRYTFAEIQASPEPVRLMRYYRALWEYHAA
jgi:sugar phosphate isomerase/epimerase